MRRLHAVLARPCSLDVVLRFSNSFILSEHPTYILTIYSHRAPLRQPRARRAAIPLTFAVPSTCRHLRHLPTLTLSPVSSMFGFLLGHDFHLEYRGTLSRSKTEPQEFNFRVADHPELGQLSQYKRVSQYESTTEPRQKDLLQVVFYNSSDGSGSASCPVVPGLSPLVTSLLSGRSFVVYLSMHEKFQVNPRILAIAV